MDDYNHFYGGKIDIVYRAKIVDMFIKHKSKLYFVTNTENRKQRPDLYRTIVHFQNGNLGEFAGGDELLVKYEKIRYNPKRTFYGQLEFYPRFLRKPLLVFKVDRYVGDNRKKRIVNFEHRTFDMVQNRINLILKED